MLTTLAVRGALIVGATATANAAATVYFQATVSVDTSATFTVNAATTAVLYASNTINGTVNLASAAAIWVSIILQFIIVESNFRSRPGMVLLLFMALLPQQLEQELPLWEQLQSISWPLLTCKVLFWSELKLRDPLPEVPPVVLQVPMFHFLKPLLLAMLPLLQLVAMQVYQFIFRIIIEYS